MRTTELLFKKTSDFVENDGVNARTKGEAMHAFCEQERKGVKFS